ncbi:DUF423 domain-containing protein [Cesiribacter sp. SM1]|uniref:DUF423 domain-containing protein n=1 Tax=Cesiribacter sp. SM1 TaxID=2861196 RepID=UPI001CD249D8|nr:DUF423 domain-containing protein [Cesiribacter sp. SM1]
MYNFFLQAGAVLAGLAVALGAFGAHGLRNMLLQTGRTANFETAAQYQMYHALAILLVGVLLIHYPHRQLVWAGWCFIVGIFFFSGSLYILSLSNVTKWGAVTPIGGVAFLAGWVLLLIAFIRNA